MTPVQEKLKILLVDDKPENLLALEAVLKDEAYILIKVSSGAQALLETLHHDFALILLDVQMPEMDGFETANILRTREKTAEIPIIFITAVYHEISYALRAYKLGAVDYITKPFDTDVLRAKVAVFSELHRKTQALIHEREERIRIELVKQSYLDLLNSLDHAIVWEAEGPRFQFLFVSNNVEKILGYPLEHWYSEENFFLSHIPEEDRPLLLPLFQSALTVGEEFHHEHRMIAFDQKVHWFHTGVQIKDIQGKAPDHLYIYRGFTVEISQLKHIEENLREKLKKYRQVVDANIIGHIFCDLSGNVTDANDYFLKMIGYTESDLKSRQLRWDKITPPEYRVVDENAIRELRDTGVCAPFEKEYIRKDGTRVPVMIGVAMMRGSTTECVCFVLDLTERKKIEEERLKAIQGREEILQVVSHDLKNPLSTILMNATVLIRRGACSTEPSVIQRQIDVIFRSAGRMKRLIEDVLDVDQIEGGRLYVKKKEQDVASLVKEVQEMMQSTAHEKSIQIEPRISKGISKSCCDRDRVLQVFSNLIGNAVRFSPVGGVVRIGVEQKGDEILFCVSDEGSGIPKVQQKYIFDRFWRGRPSEKTGSGLGLTIAKGIVDAHGGKIWVESEESKGAKFYFTLPALRDDQKCA